LFVYATAFSYAYLHLEAGAGALVLFGAVQLSMIAWGLWHGERFHWFQIAGLGLAAAGLLDGRRATTHWADVEALRAYPQIEIDGNRLHTYDPSGRDGEAHIDQRGGHAEGLGRGRQRGHAFRDRRGFHPSARRHAGVFHR
jgi:hypothetical protein